MIVVPHKLTMLRLTDCDACGTCTKCHDGTKTISLTSFFGWQCCGCLACEELILNWKSQVIIPLQQLISLYGDSVNVLRSSGSIDRDWKITGDAFARYPGDPYTIQLRHEGLQLAKQVPLEDFKHWNVCYPTLLKN
jgi:hypothetical protein